SNDGRIDTTVNAHDSGTILSCTTKHLPTPRTPLLPYTTLFRSENLNTGGGAQINNASGATFTTNFDGTIADNQGGAKAAFKNDRSEEHTSELQSLRHHVCRLLLDKINANSGTLRLSGGGSSSGT